jgi:hypothetical protein
VRVTSVHSGQRVPVEEIFDHVDHIVAVMTKLIRR